MKQNVLQMLLGVSTGMLVLVSIFNNICCVLIIIILVVISSTLTRAYGRNNKLVAVLFIDTLFPLWTGVHEVMIYNDEVKWMTMNGWWLNMCSAYIELNLLEDTSAVSLASCIKVKAALGLHAYWWADEAMLQNWVIGIVLITIQWHLSSLIF